MASPTPPRLWALICAGSTLVVLVPAIVGTAVADPGPHETRDMTNTQSCALCHRMHDNGEIGGLLNTDGNQDDLCLACHNGSGAETDVLHGVLAGDTYGVEGAGLRGGGFLWAKMDTDGDSIPESRPVTSTHTSDGVTAGVMWGSGPVNSLERDYGIVHRLACADCHNPHGNDNYRLLRSRPYGMEGRDDAPAVVVPAGEQYLRYATTYTGDGRRDLSYVPQELDDWCVQCHTRYMGSPDSAHTPTGDLVFAYRHPQTANGCLDCHVAHGTSSSTGPYSSAVQYPDPSKGSEGSALLSMDSRNVCISGCHTVESLTAD